MNVRRAVGLATSLLCLTSLLPGCAGTTGTLCSTTPLGSIYAHWHSGIVTVVAPGEACWEIDFLAFDGSVIDTVAGQGSASVTIPPGTWAHDSRHRDCPATAPPVQSGHASLRPFPGPRYGRQQGSLNLHDDSYYRGARANGPSFMSAMNRLQDVFDAGVGAPVPGGIIVDHVIDLDVSPEGITIHSALPERFETFTIEADGRMVSDLGSGLNVVAEPRGHGWTELTAVLPTSVLASARRVVIAQAGKSADEPLRVEIDL